MYVTGLLGQAKTENARRPPSHRNTRGLRPKIEDSDLPLHPINDGNCSFNPLSLLTLDYGSFVGFRRSKRGKGDSRGTTSLQFPEADPAMIGIQD